MAKIGVQAMMLKNHVTEVGAYPVWQRLSEVGFSAIEVSQIPLTRDNIDQIRRGNADFGITTAAISATLSHETGGSNSSLAVEFDKVVADARALGTSRVRIGMMPQEALRSRGTVVGFCHQAEECARRLADEGIRLSYHNHEFEFARFGRDRILDIIRAEAPSLWFELDVHWIQRGGGSPARVLRDFAGILDLVHLKDYRIGLPSPERWAALDAGDPEALAGWRDECLQFAEVGAGNLDFANVMDEGIRAGAAYLLIEQDLTYGRDIYDCLANSRRALIDLGYADLL